MYWRPLPPPDARARKAEGASKPRKRSRRLQVAYLIFAALVGAILVWTPVLENLFLLLTGAGFEIPAESSVFTFRVTVMNSGSGEWWIYGEDSANFYGVPDVSDIRYLVFSRAKVPDCPGFVPVSYETWCSQFAVPVKVR
jgi:hypothetical protein